MKLNPGMLKLSFWPTTNRGVEWSAPEEIVEELLLLPYVSEFDSVGAQPYHIIVDFDTIEDMIRWFPVVEAEILAIIEGRAMADERYRNIRRATGYPVAGLG